MFCARVKVPCDELITAYLTPNTRLRTPRPKVLHTQDKHWSSEQLLRATRPLLLPYKKPYCRYPLRVCYHTLTTDWLLVPLRTRHLCPAEKTNPQSVFSVNMKSWQHFSVQSRNRTKQSRRIPAMSRRRNGQQAVRPVHNYKRLRLKNSNNSGENCLKKKQRDSCASFVFRDWKFLLFEFSFDSLTYQGQRRFSSHTHQKTFAKIFKALVNNRLSDLWVSTQKPLPQNTLLLFKANWVCAGMQKIYLGICEFLCCVCSLLQDTCLWCSRNSVEMRGI